MFGAPFGAFTDCGNYALSVSRYVRPTSPGNRKSGRGSTSAVPVVGDVDRTSYANALGSPENAIDVTRNARMMKRMVSPCSDSWILLPTSPMLPDFREHAA